MRLETMLAGLPLTAPPDTGGIDVTGVACDSRRVAPGDLFVALPGAHSDGREHISEAVARGAVALLGPEPAPPTVPVSLPWIEAGEPRRLMGELAARVHGHPDRRLTLCGVTGTNGKSTVVALLAAILEVAGRPCGTLGTLGYAFAGEETPGEHTTPESPDFFAALGRMVDAGARAAVVEVSSHALALERVSAARFALGVFTNLSQDHLDFHDDLESYFAAKRRLFELLAEDGVAAVHIGDAWGRRLAAELPAAVTCGAGGAVEVLESRLDIEGSHLRLHWPAGTLELESRLLGRYNVDNVLCAVAGAAALELPAAAVVAGVAACKPVPGRLERVAVEAPFPVLIDYAHTEAALRAALESLRELCPGRRRIVVFGCGGDRDRGKRAPMGRVVGELADLAVLTSDNPRGEDPLAILGDVEQGLQAAGGGRYRIVPDRREAIRRAIAIADSGSVVLIAGKGHEDVQIVGSERLHFSDRDEATAALLEHHG